jgi:hypothetical protein
MNRYLYIYTPDYKNSEYKKTIEIYNDNLYEFHKRFIKTKTFKNNDTFFIELIGFDGKVKHTYKKMDMKTIFRDIEKMPMGKLRNTKNLSLYADYNPDKTIPGLGFKDKEKALYTINKIKNKNKTYQKQVLNTMINRAKYHPYKTKDMDKAIKVFQIYLKTL